jgi:hypothetical protein
VDRTVEPGRPQITTGLMRIACWITMATNTHSEFVTLIIAFPRQQWLLERVDRSLPVLLRQDSNKGPSEYKDRC